MPMTLAERLGVASATFARRLVLDRGRVSIERQTDAGYDTVECDLPALVTLTAGAAVARHPSLKDSIEAKKKPLEQLSLADIGLSADEVRPTQHVTAVEIAPEKQAGELIEDEAEAPDRIVRLLEQASAVSR
jgi:electron transfer flavoprotein beta subunit